jgi:TolB-like protein
MNPVDASRDEIQRQLERILASAHFAGAARLSRFLRYIVERTCAGESAKLKEFVIGTEVFDRDHRFDPRLDSVVRVEAGRLRSRLVEYYAGPGANDSVIIRVPRGAYVPVFELPPRADSASAGDSAPSRTEAAPAASALNASPAIAPTELPAPSPAVRRREVGAWVSLGLVLGLVAMAALRGDRTPTRSMHDVRVAVLPMTIYSNEKSAQLLAAEVTDGITRELARLGSIQVVSHWSAVHAAAEPKPLPAIAQALRADVIVAASLAQEHDNVRVQMVLVDSMADRKFWVGDVSGSISNLPELQRRVAEAAAQAVAAHPTGSYWERGR